MVIFIYLIACAIIHIIVEAFSVNALHKFNTRLVCERTATSFIVACIIGVLGGLL